MTALNDIFESVKKNKFERMHWRIFYRIHLKHFSEIKFQQIKCNYSLRNSGVNSIRPFSKLLGYVTHKVSYDQN